MKQSLLIVLTVLLIGHSQICCMEENKLRLELNKNHPFFPILDSCVFEREIIQHLDDPIDLLTFTKTCKTLRNKKNVFLEGLFKSLEKNLNKIPVNEERLESYNNNVRIVKFLKEMVIKNSELSSSAKEAYDMLVFNRTKIILLYMKKKNYYINFEYTDSQESLHSLASIAYVYQNAQVLELLFQNGAIVTPTMRDDRQSKCKELVKKYDTHKKENLCSIS